MVGFLGNSVSRATTLRRIREILGYEPAMTFKDLPDEVRKEVSLLKM